MTRPPAAMPRGYLRLLSEEVELHREEERQDRLEQPRHDAGVVDILKDPLAVVQADLARGVESSDDDVAREAREALHRSRARDAPVAVALEGLGELRALRGRREHLGDHHGIL